jgi:carboxypeptidase C (cathepsin A)
MASRWNRSLLLVLAALMSAPLGTAAAAAQDQGADQKPPAGKEPTPAPTPTPAPPPAVSHHKILLGGKSIAYAATAATIDLKDAKNEAIARMFFVAYTAEGTDAKQRPVTFAFNGGPGSASLWLHMGSFGPIRVETSDARYTAPPPYQLVENSESLLDRTDLVFVDAVGTGFSRIIGKGEPKNFYGTDQDVAAFAQFIERWVTANNRWNSPKFLLGESYGTTRGAALLAHLENKGMAFNGAILVSSYLNAWDDFNGPPFSNDRAYELYLPTMAAAAWYHNKLDPRPSDLPEFLAEVRKFALGEYEHALQQGNRLDEGARASVVGKLRRYTGLPEAFIRNANLRIDPSRFEKELLRGERRTVGRLDARFSGWDHDAAGEFPEYDPASTAIAAAFTAAFNSYVRESLGYKTEDLYKPTNFEEVGKDWDDRHRAGGGRSPMPDVAEDLRSVMSVNGNLKIFSANGYFDFATPFFETEYTLAHMGLEPVLEKNISFGYYPSGHMIYLHEPALKQMKADLARFYDQTMAR